MRYHGSCHCGKVAFDIDTEQALDTVMACNCSICSRKGSLLWFVPREQLRLQTPESDVATYTFNRHVIKHRFCPSCGVHPYAEGTHPSGKAMAAVNVRCLEGVDLDKLTVTHFDGRSA